MIHFAKQMIVSETIEKKTEKIMNKLIKKKLTSEIYVITFSSNKDNLFDIINANELLSPVYQRADLLVLGLAKGREEAVMIVKDMIELVYQQTGGFDVRAYYKE